LASGRRTHIYWVLLALPLLVAEVFADDHHATVTTNDLALVADRLDARLDLHGLGLSSYVAVESELVLFVAVDDAPAGEVVRRELYDDPILREDPDVVLTHLAADVSEHLVTIAQLHSEHRVGQGLDHAAFDLDGPVFLGHILHASSCILLMTSSPHDVGGH
jgi:hypothetical protein